MINVKRYIVDFNKFVTQRIPEELAFNEVINYAKALVGPVVTLYNKLLAFRDLLVYKISITPQVVYLEKLLNDRFDNVERRIYIEDGSIYDPLYIYTEAELQPVFLYTEAEANPQFIYTQNEVSEITSDFVVFVPSTLTFNYDQMVGLIKDFKLASKLFQIQTFAE